MAQSQRMSRMTVRLSHFEPADLQTPSPPLGESNLGRNGGHLSSRNLCRTAGRIGGETAGLVVGNTDTHSSLLGFAGRELGGPCGTPVSFWLALGCADKTQPNAGRLQ
jgi:hypothetical protein